MISRVSTTANDTRVLPLRRAELVVPAADGGQRRIRKVCGRTPGGRVALPHFRLIRDNLVRVDSLGNPLHAVKLDRNEKPGLLHLNADGTRAFFGTSDAIYSLDAASGQVIAKRPFARFDREVRPLDFDGVHAVTADGSRMLWLDSDLKTQHVLDTHRPIREFIRLAGGATAIRHWGQPTDLTIVGADRKARLMFADIGHPMADADGRMWCIEGISLPRNVPRRVVSYDPVSGETMRVETSPRASAIIPRRDGSFLVLDYALDRPTLLLYRPGKNRPRIFDFGSPGYLRQLLLTQDDRTLYATIDRTSFEEWRAGHSVYRIDLDAEASVRQWVGMPTTAEALYVLKDKRSTPHLGVTADGQLLFAREKDAILVDPRHGSVRYLGHGKEEVRNAMQDNPVVTRSVDFGMLLAPATDVGLEPLLAAVMPGDGCLNIPLPDSARVIGDDPVAPPPSSPVVGGVAAYGAKRIVEEPMRYAVNGNRIAVRFWPAGFDPTTVNVFFAPKHARFERAADIRTHDNRKIIVASTDDGNVLCYNADDELGARPLARYSMGAPIERLENDGQGHLVAEARNGTLLMIEP